MKTIETKNVDLYIKEEGIYADIRLESDRAKDWAAKKGFENCLKGITPDDTYCGEKVWNRTTRTGPYHFTISVHQIEDFMDVIDESGLTYESDF